MCGNCFGALHLDRENRRGCLPACLQVEQWSQCGGRSSGVKANTSDPAACCPVGWSCNYFNEWWAGLLWLAL